MQFPTGLKEDLRKNQKSCLVKGPATLSSSTALFEPGLNSWPFYPEKPSGDSAQMTNTKCIRKECPPLEKFSGNKEAVVGVECDDMEMMRQLKALKSSIFNEKDDPRVYRKIGSISRMENPNERKIHGVSNSTAILLSRIGKDHTAELTEARIIRQSGGKDRHSKVVTSRGLRDRRVRLSVRTAVQFYEVVDRLGYDQPSKAVEWLIKEAKSAIDELACLPDLGLQKFNAVDWASAGNASRIQKKPILDAADYGSCWTSFSSCNDSSTLKGTRVSGMNPTPEKVGFESARMSESMNGDFATQGHKSFLEKESSFADPHDLSSIFKQAMDCWSSLRNETKNRASSFACAEFQQVAQERETKKAAVNGSRVEACGEAAAYLPYSQPDHSFYGALSDAHQRAASRCGQQEASQFDRGPSEGAIICKSTSSSSIEAPQRSAFPQNFWQNMALYASQNHKTPLSQSGLQGQFHPDPFQFSYPDASALRSSQFHSSVAVLHSTLSTITQFPPSFPAMSQALSSNTGNDVQENANIVVPSEIPVRGGNIVSPPAVSSIRSVPDFDDERNSNVALLQSNALLPPEVKDSRLPITFQGSNGDQITKIAPLHQGYLVNSLLAGGCSVLDQEDLSLQGSAYAEQMLSSIRSPLTDAGEDFASSSTFPLAYSSMGSLQSIQINPVPPSGTSGREISSRPGPRLQIVPTATRNSHRSFMSSSSQIPARIYCIEDSEDDWMA